jgi:hypothetical protein
MRGEMLSLAVMNLSSIQMSPMVHSYL